MHATEFRHIPTLLETIVYYIEAFLRRRISRTFLVTQTLLKPCIAIESAKRGFRGVNVNDSLNVADESHQNETRHQLEIKKSSMR